MAKLKIYFGGSINEIAPYWLPVIAYLQSKTTGKIESYAIREPKANLTDDPDTGTCYYEISGLPNEIFDLSIKDTHSNHPLLDDQAIDLSQGDAGFKIHLDEMDPNDATLQANTYGMDLVADAPYRLQKSMEYLPLVIHMKDIEAGKYKISSVDINIFGYGELTNGDFDRVLDNDGQSVETEGQPSILRYDPGKTYETVNRDPWYRIIFIPRENLSPVSGPHLIYENARYTQIQVKVSYKRGWLIYSQKFLLRTLLPDEDLPKPDDWYYGDTHYHSEFTDNPYEYGGPIRATAEAARSLGLSWLTVTDHSYGLSRSKENGRVVCKSRWEDYKKKIEEIDSTYRDILLIGAEEITVEKPVPNIPGLHLLSFNNPFVEDQDPFGFGSLSLDQALDKIMRDYKGGFIYAAHPASDGYTWEDSDYSTAMESGYDDLFMGLQLFNEKVMYAAISRAIYVNYLNPFEIFDSEDRKRDWDEELDRGIDQWVHKLLRPSLVKYKESGKLRKYFAIAGSDAHMDFNYSIRPHPAFVIHKLYDNAFGKVRTLAFFPENTGSLTEGDLYNALKTGKTILTDGPVVLFFLLLEDSDRIYRFGDTVFLPPGKKLKMVIEWHSTREFGPLQSIRLIMGTAEKEFDRTEHIDFSHILHNRSRFSGRVAQTIQNWVQSPCYLRLEASSGFERNENLFRCLTNPIWIVQA